MKSNSKLDQTKEAVVRRCSVIDRHREKAPSNKTPAFPQSMNIDIWVVSTSNQLFIRGS